MPKIIRIISLILVFSQINLNYAFSGEFFWKGNCSEKEQKIQLGYKIAFGTESKNIQEKLAQETSGEEDFFAAPELGAIAFLILMMLILTNIKGTPGPKSGGGDGDVTKDSRLEEISAEIKASPEVTESGIPETNILAPAE